MDCCHPLIDPRHHGRPREAVPWFEIQDRGQGSRRDVLPGNREEIGRFVSRLVVQSPADVIDARQNTSCPGRGNQLIHESIGDREAFGRLDERKLDPGRLDGRPVDERGATLPP